MAGRRNKICLVGCGYGYIRSIYSGMPSLKPEHTAEKALELAYIIQSCIREDNRDTGSSSPSVLMIKKKGRYPVIMAGL